MTDLSDALSHLDDGLQLVLDRDGARWQHPDRTALFVPVDRHRAERWFSELCDRFEVRRENGTRIVTPVPRDDYEPQQRSYLVDGICPLTVLAGRLDMTYNGLSSAVTRGEFSTILKKAPASDGIPRKVAHAVADEDLASYLASRGRDGFLRTPGGDELRLRSYRETIELSKPRYSRSELADLLSVARTTVCQHLTGTEVPERTGYYGRIEYPTGAALARALEASFSVNVTLGAGVRQEVPA